MNSLAPPPPPHSSDSYSAYYIGTSSYCCDKLRKQKKVTFDLTPTVYEYEPEYDTVQPTNTLMIEGWPGKTKDAMKSVGFIDFKSKIEAKLSALNDADLISQLEQNDQDPPTSIFERRFPRLNLIPVSTAGNETPGLLPDNTPSPSNSVTDTPSTPKDDQPVHTMDRFIKAFSKIKRSASFIKTR
ncbi:hypothetical protein BDB01DRAFT_837220 [Pilobolus umbonatus]|nr:hypothetical protein BDB01DRAFT_837220 [Pilobolus umbonatus]